MDLASGRKQIFNKMTSDDATNVENMDRGKILDALRLSNHDFSFSLYSEIASKETGNIFYSPFSIHVVIFMASIGAASETFDEIIATLRLNKINHSLEAYRIFLEKIMYGGYFCISPGHLAHVKIILRLFNQGESLRLGTGMFVDSSFNVKNSFIENCMNYLKSSMEKLNFKNYPEEQRQYLNNWVLEKTDNKIKDIFSEGSIDSDTTLILANALHFKCPWHFEFFHTSEESFYVSSTNEVVVNMMTLCDKLEYRHDDELKCSVLQLPYMYNAYIMIILLPDDKDGLRNLESNFSKINLCEISNKLSTFKVTVKLPRFKIEQSLQLKEALTSLGCSTMFTENANFSNIVDDNNLRVSDVVHKAYVDVNEKGTEAAAATSARLKPMCAVYGLRTANFFADHPFIFSIMSPDKDVLFMGRLFEP